MIPEASAATRSSGGANKSRPDGAKSSGAKSSGALDHSEDESGNENRQKSERRRKRPHAGSENAKRKSAKTRHGAGVGGSRGGRRGRGRVEAVTLFEVVTMGRSAMEAVIDDWIGAYATDRDFSLLNLISFFIQCSGCKGVVTAEMCQGPGDGDVMSKMVEELDEASGLQYKKFLAFPWILTVTWPTDTDGVEYPLTQSGAHGRWFHSEFCDFISVLVARCRRGVLFDGYLLNALLSLLAELSDSCVRAFRHTCTLAGVKLLTSLVGVAQSLRAGVENSQKLYEVQTRTRTRTTRQRSPVQPEGIRTKVTELREKKAEVESAMDIIFKGVFLKRYRDMLPEIRSICAEELGAWMKLYSCTFLNDSYLKYLGWMMYDKAPDVRLKCVSGLQRLYADPLLLPKLDLFTSRFKDRMISMTLDRDSEVAVQSMKLLLLISRTCEDVLTPEDYKQLLQFVYSSQRPLAAAAGELLFSRLLIPVAPTSDTQNEVNQEEAHIQQTLSRLKALLQFYRESELHAHVAYLVDSLWDCGGALLKDWPTLTAVLLRDPPSRGAGLTQAEQAVLVGVLVASVRQASEGPALAGRSGAKKAMSVRDKKTLSDDCAKLTEHLLTVLPKLLSKFSSSCDVVASLMKIPQYFHPECSRAENAQAVSILMAEIGAALELHSGAAAVLEAAARTCLALCGEQQQAADGGSVARAATDSLVRRWVDRLAALLGDSPEGDIFSAGEEKTGEVVAVLKKIKAFHNCHDLSRWNLFELLSPLLPLEGGEAGTPPEVLLEVLPCLSYSLLWSLSASGGPLTSREKADAQRPRLRLFCERGHRCLSHADPGVRQQAFVGVCDVLTAHSYQLHVWDPASSGPPLYTPSPKLQRALLAFVSTHVFVEPDSDSQCSVGETPEEARLEDCHRRRNLLAAYCKLIVHGVLEMSAAADVFACYAKYYNDFGDIIKETINRTRQIDKIESARTLVLCLQQLFTRLQRGRESGGRSRPAVQTFPGVKELARRFALTFGDHVKHRECVVTIHRNGVEFVFQGFSQTPGRPAPPHLSYLTLLSEFSSKLLKPDKKAMFCYLQKHAAEHVVDLREERWQPLVHYRASLLAAAEGDDAVSHVSSDRKPCLAKQKQEGSKSPRSLSPADSKLGRGPRRSFSPSRRARTTTDAADPLAVPADPPAQPSDTAASSVDEADDDDDTVEIEL